MSFYVLNLCTVRLTSNPAGNPAASNLSFNSGVMNELTVYATYFCPSIRALRSFIIGSMYFEGPETAIIGVASSNLLLAQ
jgi:hypothetical protein